MARTVMLSEEAYSTLTGAKREGESYSDVVLRLLGPRRERLRAYRKWIDAYWPNPALAKAIEDARRELGWRGPE